MRPNQCNQAAPFSRWTRHCVPLLSPRRYVSLSRATLLIFLVVLLSTRPVFAGQHYFGDKRSVWSENVTAKDREKIYDEQLELVSQYLRFGGEYFAAADCETRQYEKGTEDWNNCISILGPFYSQQSEAAASEALSSLALLVADQNICVPHCPRKTKLLHGLTIRAGGNHPDGGGYCNGLIINSRCYGSTFTEAGDARECYGNWRDGQCENDYFAEDR